MARGRVTIATHSGNEVAIEHNYDKAFRDRETEHIDAERPIQTLCYEEVAQAYEDLFGDAVKEYNEARKRKGHPEARINSYYGKVLTEYTAQQAKIEEELRTGVPELKRTAETKCPPVRELIIGVYPQKNSALSAKENCAILKEFYEQFKTEYPSLCIVGAVIHEDEAAIHMHLDFIPVSRNNSRGLAVQNSMSGALRDMGFKDGVTVNEDGKTVKRRGSALREWNRSVNGLLETICAEHGLSVEHPMRDTGAEHMSTEQYKAVMQQAEADAAALKEQAEADIKVLKKQAETDAKALKKQAETDAAALKKQAEADIKVLKEQAEADIKVLKEQAETDAEALKKQAEADIKVQKEQAEADIKVLKEQAETDAEADAEALKADAAAVKAKADDYLKDAKALYDEYAINLRHAGRAVPIDTRFNEMAKRAETEEQFGG